MNIFIDHTYLISGGIEVSLLNFMHALIKNNSIDLFLFKNTGAKNDQIPKNVQVQEAIGKLKNSVADSQSAGQIKKERTDFKKILKSFLKLFGAKNIYNNIVINEQKTQSKNYDVAICFNGLSIRNVLYILKKVEAKKKLAFVHSDVANVKIEKQVLKNLKKFDKILCVSESCADVFKKTYPELAEKTDYLYNFQNIEEIKQKSKELEISYPKNAINIVSVSRLSEEKAHIRTLEVLKKLKQEGFEFNYHIVGEGETQTEIEEYIKNNNMQDFVKMYGNQVNPYPYIKGADLFLLGSRHEAAPMVFAESMMLGIPVLTTETRSAKELVGDYGFVCENSSEGLYASLKEILSNKKQLQEKKENLKNYKFDNEKIAVKFEEIIKNI